MRHCSSGGHYIVASVSAVTSGAPAVTVVSFAWHQKHEMTEVFVIIRRCSYRKRFGEDLSTIVDVEGVGYLQA
jgi:hypothetical protein